MAVSRCGAGDDDRVTTTAPPERVANRWTGWPLSALFVVLALLPLTASAATIAPGWLPVGDDATIEMRGRDLLTTEMPLIGMPSAIGEQTDRPAHHPGPLELWWVGLWVRLLGIGQASLIAATAAWGASIAAIVVFARRLGGIPLLALSAVLVATVTWSLRGEVPVTPFNAHAIVLPLAAYLLALVAWHRRIPWAGAVAIVTGSWAAQSHLTAVGPVLAAGAVVVAATVARSVRSPSPVSVQWRSVALAVAVLAACWSGPLVDLVVNDGGNVRAVLGARSDLATEAIGPDRAAEIVVRALAWRPVWASAGAHPSDFARGADARHWATAIAVLGGAVAGGIRRRRTHPTLAVTVGAAGAALVVGALLAARFPNEHLSLLALHNHLWLWPLTTVVWGAALVAVGLEVRDLANRAPGRAGSALGPTTAAVGVFALLAVGVASFGEPHRALTLATPTYVRALGDGAIARLDRDETYRVVISGDFDRFFVELGLLSYLEGAGLDVVGSDSHRQALGERRTEPKRPLAGDLVVDLGFTDDDVDGPGLLLSEFRPAPALRVEQMESENRLAALLMRHSDWLPLLGMSGTDDDEIRRYLREDLDGYVISGLVPDALARAQETEDFLDLRRRPVLRATLRLVPAEGR